MGNHSTQRLLLWLIGLIVILALVFSMRYDMSRIAILQPTPSAPPLGEKIRSGETPIPEYTQAIADKLANSKGFQALASYTDTGFEPIAITVKTGETVRFTNNSSRNLWVASAGEKLYPHTRSTCGSSDLDSCAPITPQDFYEFSFTQRGKWVVTNNLDKSKTLTVTVR